MNNYDRAEYEAQKNEDAMALAEPHVGAACEWCCEPMESPIVFRSMGFLGRMVEQVACSEDCQLELSSGGGPDPDREDFGADHGISYSDPLDYYMD